jgi:hypothetical protein
LIRCCKYRRKTIFSNFKKAFNAFLVMKLPEKPAWMQLLNSYYVIYLGCIIIPPHD